MTELTVCPGTLKAGFDSYSPAALRNVFSSKQVSYVLPYLSPKKDEETNELFMENRKRISISGVQEKLSIIQVKNKLRLTEAGEQGSHILKPIPVDLKKVVEIPANEHLTMQIARQLYGINTAANALIFFQDGEPAYITKRFDLRKDGMKWNKEDFASLAGKTSQNANSDYKYEYDYVQIGKLIKQYIPAWRIEIERYFSMVVFNYLFSNGDAHLKNFAVLENKNGDYLLSPAYDLINTRLHVDDSSFALNGGLMNEELRSDGYQRTDKPENKDFVIFGREIGIADKRIEKLLIPFCERNDMVEVMINNSFLSESLKRGYLLHYNNRRNQLTK
ncbi:MAG: HipA domain-containing protein [Bacteroidales bacterium]|nr:HipA domain-containing protein [Bacteroidales bacterium]